MIMSLSFCVFGFSVDTFSGDNLTLVKLDRKQMGAYLCIASNDVPPAVSKRITLNVNCKYAGFLLLPHSSCYRNFNLIPAALVIPAIVTTVNGLKPDIYIHLALSFMP